MAAYANQIIVMHEGEVLLNGSPEEVFSNFDLIQDLGLRMPQVSEYAHKLKQAGIFDVGEVYPVTLETAVETFLPVFGGKND